MKKIYQIIIFVALAQLAAPPAYSCMSFNNYRDVKIKNSPFYFDEFTISGEAFSVTSSDGSKLTLSCKKKGRKQLWKVNAHNNDGKKYIFDLDFEKTLTVADDKDTTGTKIVVLPPRLDYALTTIKNKGSDNGKSIRVLCSYTPDKKNKEVGNHKMTVHIFKGNLRIAAISAQARIGGARPKGGLSGEIPKKIEVDFSSNERLLYNVLNSGCGSALEGQSPSVEK